jgi:Peptidase inhibitor family I36
MINLASGWQGAQSCAVYSRTDVRCFASTGEADASLGYSRAKDPLVALAPAATPACASGWLCLYEFVNGGGRRLQFHDEYWNYLSDYGFDRQTSSWRNNQGSGDAGALSLYNRSTVYTCGANTYVASLGTYDNQAYAVWG